jgi:hypothetical protein
MDEGVDTLSVGSRGEGPSGTGGIGLYYFRDDDRRLSGSNGII